MVEKLKRRTNDEELVLATAATPSANLQEPKERGRIIRCGDVITSITFSRRRMEPLKMEVVGEGLICPRRGGVPLSARLKVHE